MGETFDAYVKETGSKLKVLDEGILLEVKKEILFQQSIKQQSKLQSTFRNLISMQIPL